MNLDIPHNNIFLLPQDVFAGANYLIRMKFGIGTLDDMNHLKNKHIHSVADHGLILTGLVSWDPNVVLLEAEMLSRFQPPPRVSHLGSRSTFGVRLLECSSGNDILLVGQKAMNEGDITRSLGKQLPRGFAHREVRLADEKGERCQPA